MGLGGVDKDGRLYSIYAPKVDRLFYSGDEILNYFLPNLISNDPKTGTGLQLHMSAWAAMFSLDLIKRSNWRFVSEREIIAEDVYSLLDLYSNVHSVSIISDYLYFYCINGGSLTKSYRPDRYDEIRKFYLRCVELCKDKKYNQDIVDRLQGPYLAFTIAAMKQESQHKAFRNKKIYAIVSDDIFQAAISKRRGETFKRKIFYWVAKKRYVRLCELILRLQHA